MLERMNMNDRLGTVVTQFEGSVPHTVIRLASGRTLAHGLNPDKTPGNRPGLLVDLAINALLGLEERARQTMGSVVRSERDAAVAAIAAVQGRLEQHAASLR